MIRQLALILAAFLSVAPVLAQTPPVPVADPADVRVLLQTDKGPIVIAVHQGKAPVTAANFLKYVDEKRFDGTAFYRGVGAPDYGFVQGGAQNDPKRILPPIAHEPTSRTGLVHDDGALSMARYAPGSATGDFFVVLGRGSPLVLFETPMTCSVFIFSIISSHSRSGTSPLGGIHSFSRFSRSNL